MINRRCPSILFMVAVFWCVSHSAHAQRVVKPNKVTAAPAAVASPAKPAAVPTADSSNKAAPAATVKAPQPAATAAAKPASKPQPAKTAKAPTKTPAKTPAKAQAASAAKPAAEEKPKEKPKPPPAKPSEAIKSSDPEQVHWALQQMAKKPSAKLIRPVTKRLREGLPPALARQAMEVLAATGKRQAAAVLVEYLQHRRASHRRTAVMCLGKLGARQQTPDLLAMLDDPDSAVRASTVVSLGMLGDRRALPALYVALEAGDGQAAMAIGRMAKPADTKKLLGYAAKLPFSVLRAAIAELLRRKSFPLRGKLDLIAQLGELGNPGAVEVLRDALQDLPKSSKKTMMRAIAKAMAEATTSQLDPPTAPPPAPAPKVKP